MIEFPNELFVVVFPDGKIIPRSIAGTREAAANFYLEQCGHMLPMTKHMQDCNNQLWFNMCKEYGCKVVPAKIHYGE